MEHTYVLVETEELVGFDRIQFPSTAFFQVYSWESFVTEFGGALGYFLGFSFISLWDGVELLVGWICPSKGFTSMSAVCGCQIDIVEIYMSMT